MIGDRSSGCLVKILGVFVVRRGCMSNKEEITLLELKAFR